MRISDWSSDVCSSDLTDTGSFARTRLQMKLELNQEQRAMVESVRQLANDRFKPRVMKSQDGTFPWENIKDLADLGVLGMGVPEEYGDLGLPVLDCAIVHVETPQVGSLPAQAGVSGMGVTDRV